MAIITTNHGEVRELTLDWPDVRNAMGPEQGRELRLAIEQANAEAGLAALVITANGKAFCAGGNLPEILRMAKEGGREGVKSTIYGEFQGLFRAIHNSPVPVITAVDGPAVGFGCDLALAGQATFIGARGWIAQGWIKAGLIPATGGTMYVKRRGGQQAVWRLLAAERVDGPTAESWGLAIACEDARQAALHMAQTFASYPRGPLRALTNLSRIDEPVAHLDAALEHQLGFICSPDFEAFAKRLLAGK